MMASDDLKGRSLRVFKFGIVGANENFESPYDTQLNVNVLLCERLENISPRPDQLFSRSLLCSNKRKEEIYAGIVWVSAIDSHLLILQHLLAAAVIVINPFYPAERCHRTTTTTDLPVKCVDLLQKMQAFTNCMQIMPSISTTFTTLIAVATRLRILQHN